MPAEIDSARGAGNLGLTRSYNSQLVQDLGFGYGWSGLSPRLKVYDTTIHVIETSGRGEVYTCPSSGGACTGNADSPITLTRDASGYTLTRRDAGLERYDTSGLLLTKTDSAGLVTAYAYTNGRLSQITGPHGHTQSVTYTGDHITSITDAGGVYQYSYDANNNLTRVTYPDGSGKRYHYENASFVHHLTGVSFVETNGAVTRYTTYSYDASGKAVSTELAAGAERFTLSYDSATQTTVTDAANTQEVMTFAPNLGVKNLVAKVNGADGKSLAQTFDANNNLTCKKDEEGRVTTYTYNATNQRVSMTEGLTGDCTAPQTTSATRTTSYSYVSPTLDVPALIQAPSVHTGSSKTTSLSYGDTRFPTLPTGITQSGYTPSGAVVSRTVGLSYNAFGQVTSINGPRTDVNDVTTLSYYTCTTGNACGQLASVTNAAGHVTTYDSYDGNGRLVQMTDANGLRTNYAYDGRGRVTAITQTPPGGTARVTGYSYNAAGNVTFTGFPDGRTLTYTYNAAQQLLSVVDNLGNRVSYGFDAKGNRTQEYTYDPDGTLVRAIETAYDLRNHVSQLNHGGSVTQHVTDALGNLTRTTDPNQVATSSGISTQHSYDALSRLIATLDNLNGNTSYGYNHHDRLTQVSAPNGATTQYVYDDLGNLLQETSPDRGTTAYTYDAAGNVLSQTDARGITTSYTYDALNRVVGINYPADPDVSYTYDSGSGCTSGIGRLCQVTDASGTTQYGYDAFGNVTTQIKTELGRNYTMTYGYDLGHRVTSITYPDNRVVSYGRDGVGRIASVNTTVNGVATVIAANRAYRADGLLLSQTYGNGISEVRTHDTQGRLTYQSLGSIDTRVYTYDANGNLTQKQSLPEVGTYGYDLLDRLSDVTRTAISGTTDLYRYDPNGNRVQDSSGSYTYASTSNRMSTRPGGTPTLDAAGNTLNDGQGLSLTYNNAGQIATATKGGVTASYTYNAQRQRTRKVVGTTTTVYHYDVAGNLIAETDSAGNSVRAYAYADGVPLGQIDKETPAPYEQIVDNAQATFTGTWPTSTSISGYYGTNYRTNTKGTGNDKATWTVSIPSTGSYQVYARWVASSAHASNAPYSIRHSSGTSTVAVSQRTNGGTWRLLGTYTFNAGNTTVTLTDKANGTVIADAVRVLGTQPNGPTQEVVRYLHTDHQGTPRAATNAQGTKVWSHEGEAFGNTPPTGTVTVNLRYAGQYADAETGLFYNWNRYYSPQLGRYITSDPIGLLGGLNTYGYAYQNPLRFTDPTGLRGPGTAPGISPGGGGTTISVPGSNESVEAVLRGALGPKMGSDPDMKNVIQFPGSRPENKSPNQCSVNDPPDDPCPTAQIRLENNRKFGEQILTSLGGTGAAVNQYNAFARSFNRTVREHNRACPNNKVAELPEINGPTGTVQ